MDAAIKILIKFNRNFWGQGTFKIFGGSLVPVYTSAGPELSATNRTLIIEAFGKDAEVLGVLTEGEMKEAILDELDAMFDGGARLNNEINEFLKMDWTADPNIQGGYSYPLVGGSDEDRIVLAEAVNEQLYFAGEATSVNYGTLDGAFESGARVTQNIIDHILEEQSQ